jgi:Mitochondrial carrier protein
MNTTTSVDVNAWPFAATDFTEGFGKQEASSKSDKEEWDFFKTVFEKSCVNTMAGMNAVTCYQPFRAWATQLMRHQPVSFKIQDMYKGFFPQLMTSHQLVIMGMADAMIARYVFGKENKDMNRWESFIKASFAGMLSAPSVTPFEMMNVQMQTNPGSTFRMVWERVMNSQDKTVKYKGFTPTLMRNWGVGVGMFFVPEQFKKMVGPYVSKEWMEEHPVTWSVVSNIFGGIFGTAVTQVPDMARVKMQSDKENKYPTARSAFEASAKEVFKPGPMKAFLCRMGVVGVATVVMLESRKLFDNMLKESKTKET